MKKILIFFTLLISCPALADIPATPVMTLYKFSGALEVPYYTIESFQNKGARIPAGTLTQGSSVIPCLVIRNGRPLTDSSGTPYVGFNVIVDSRKATWASTRDFEEIVERRKSMRVANHHCDNSVKYVINVRNMYQLEKEPFFDPPISSKTNRTKMRGKNELDSIVRAFHNSVECANANRSLIGRRDSLNHAWDRFIRNNQKYWSIRDLERARHLDYTMRTAIYEGHLDRGCTAYGACERNIIALSIRNRGDTCSGYQGCSHSGDYQGIASKISQYNIWDEYITQISGLTSCFLRDDLRIDTSSSAGNSTINFNSDYYKKISSMYEQNVNDVERILFGGDGDLKAIFPHTPLSNLNGVRHYYHAPAMRKCFPNHNRVEYMSGAVARNGDNFALIANTRIKVDQEVDGGYLFREFILKEEMYRDVTSIMDNYPGFVVDKRKVSLRESSGCPPYGIPRGCKFKKIERYRRTPSWLHAGRPVAIQCRIRDRGEQCLHSGEMKTVSVGDVCDTQMRPVAGVH